MKSKKKPLWIFTRMNYTISGPIGAVVGGIVGGAIGYGASLLEERLTCRLFGIPQDEALENAYKYFGVDHTASNSEINTAFRRKCLQTHPDKGGSCEDFHFTQYSMQVIKTARNGMTSAS